MENSKNCTKCAAQIPQNASICPVCGANQNEPAAQQFQQPGVNQQPNNQNQQQPTGKTGEKDKSNTLILANLPYYIQINEIHRIYTGHIGIGILQFITFGGCWIWTLIDIIQIISGKYTDAEGRHLKGKDIF